MNWARVARVPGAGHVDGVRAGGCIGSRSRQSLADGERTRARVRVRVAPITAGAHAGIRGSFVPMRYQDRLPGGWLEGEAVSTLLEDRRAVETCRHRQ
ncbi:MAG: Scr1 family TA system antitoxin-like transcriptional regulator [Kibdelosporangium sp.]